MAWSSTKALLIYARAPTGIPYGEVPVQRLQRPAAADLRSPQHVALGPLLHEFGMRHRVVGLDLVQLLARNRPEYLVEALLGSGRLPDFGIVYLYLYQNGDLCVKQPVRRRWRGGHD